MNKKELQSLLRNVIEEANVFKRVSNSITNHFIGMKPGQLFMITPIGVSATMKYDLYKMIEFSTVKDIARYEDVYTKKIIVNSADDIMKMLNYKHKEYTVVEINNNTRDDSITIYRYNTLREYKETSHATIDITSNDYGTTYSNYAATDFYKRGAKVPGSNSAHYIDFTTNFTRDILAVNVGASNNPVDINEIKLGFFGRGMYSTTIDLSDNQTVELYL